MDVVPDVLPCRQMDPSRVRRGPGTWLMTSPEEEGSHEGLGPAGPVAAPGHRRRVTPSDMAERDDAGPRPGGGAPDEPARHRVPPRPAPRATRVRPRSQRVLLHGSV